MFNINLSRYTGFGGKRKTVRVRRVDPQIEQVRKVMASQTQGLILMVRN